MAKVNGNNLPAYTTVENMLLLLDILKRKKKEDEVRAIFGKGNTAYTGTKSAVRAFGLIEEDSLELTDKGRTVAYSQEADKKCEIQRVLVSYPSYEVFLLNLLQKENLSSTEVGEIVNFWGKANNGSTERNREDGAKLFMSIIDYLELGRYVVGRGSNATRIEWKDDVKERIRGMFDAQNSSDMLIESKENEIEEIVVAEKEVHDDTLLCASTPSEIIIENRKQGYSNNIAKGPHITINVDMSDWNDEKIKLFFKYAYGQFGED